MAKLRANNAAQQSSVQQQQQQGNPTLPELAGLAGVSEADLAAQKKKSNFFGMAVGAFMFMLIASVPLMIRRFRRMQEESEYDIPAAGGGTKRTSRKTLRMKAQRVATDELDAESASDEEDSVSEEEVNTRSSRRRDSRQTPGRINV